MSTHLPHLDVGSGRQRGALTLFPVWIDAPSVHGIEWRTTGLEVGGSRPTMLAEGDLFDDGMQHRMTSSSTLLPDTTRPGAPLLHFTAFDDSHPLLVAA